MTTTVPFTNHDPVVETTLLLLRNTEANTTDRWTTPRLTSRHLQSMGERILLASLRARLSDRCSDLTHISHMSSDHEVPYQEARMAEDVHMLTIYLQDSRVCASPGLIPTVTFQRNRSPNQ
nr:hypothetical protein CFP56_42073 [Quercus suber]